MAYQLRVAVAVAKDTGLVSSTLTAYVTVKSHSTYSFDLCGMHMVHRHMQRTHSCT